MLGAELGGCDYWEFNGHIEKAKYVLIEQKTKH